MTTDMFHMSRKHLPILSHSWLITGFVTRVERRVPLVEQELLFSFVDLLSVLRFMDYDYPFGILKLFLFKNVSSELDKYLIDKELQDTDDLISCVAPFRTIPFLVNLFILGWPTFILSYKWMDGYLDKYTLYLMILH
jgi:hypothetical protein